MRRSSSKTSSPRFSKETLEFLNKAGRQKNPEWLARNQETYERVLLEPLKNLAQTLKDELSSQATGYHFPTKGIGRLRRPAHRVSERGGSLFKNWMAYSASRPAESRFEHNPNLFFLINPEDRDDSVLVAGGLYIPSSRQVRTLRERISEDASAFERLFKDRKFSRHFPGGFSAERTSSRVPKGFAPDHPRMDWIKLQAFFVWHPYKMKEFSSSEFPQIVAEDWKQILRLNELLDQALAGRKWQTPQPRASKDSKSRLLNELEELDIKPPKLEF
jgi:uncharacterized protein (TIGR02453 family)